MVMSLHLATGLVTSLTVTVALQVELLPLGSATVSTTVLLPTLLQSKLVLLAARLTPQAIGRPPLLTPATLEARTPSSAWKVMSLHFATGLVASLTVTTASPAEL